MPRAGRLRRHAGPVRVRVGVPRGAVPGQKHGEADRAAAVDERLLGTAADEADAMRLAEGDDGGLVGGIEREIMIAVVVLYILILGSFAGLHLYGHYMVSPEAEQVQSED